MLHSVSSPGHYMVSKTLYEVHRSKTLYMVSKTLYEVHRSKTHYMVSKTLYEVHRSKTLFWTYVIMLQVRTIWCWDERVGGHRL